MKKALRYIVPAALFFGLVYIYITQEQKFLRTQEKYLTEIETLNIENTHLQKLSDSLFDRTVILDGEMGDLEKKADSLGEIADGSDLPCEHELELRKGELVYVRKALDKCKETKAIQTTRIGLCEMRIENQVEITEKVQRISSKELKREKRKSFLKGAGTGGLIIGILIILAL
jgi:hypothetical protein